MTLTIAINLDDYIILTGDERLTIEYEDPKQDSNFKVLIDNYKKIKQWKHGAMVTSGDVNLMNIFHFLIQKQAENNQSYFDFLAAAKQAKSLYTQLGIPNEKAIGWAYFTLFNFGRVILIGVSINSDMIEYSTIEPMHANFSLFEGSSEDPIYQDFVDCLKPVNAFENFIDFYRYHKELIKAFYRRQKSFDNSITSSFDLYIQNTKTGFSLSLRIEN